MTSLGVSCDPGSGNPRSWSLPQGTCWAEPHPWWGGVGGEAPQGQGERGTGLCTGHNCLLSSDGGPVWPVAAGTAASSSPLTPSAFFLQASRCPAAQRLAGPGRRVSRGCAKPRAAVGDLPSALCRRACARSTDTFLCLLSRVPGAQIWTPAGGGRAHRPPRPRPLSARVSGPMCPAPRSLSLSWRWWQTPPCSWPCLLASPCNPFAGKEGDRLTAPPPPQGGSKEPPRA